MATSPKAKPKLGPSARPPRMITTNIGWKPEIPEPRGRSAAANADSNPNKASALASIPPREISAPTTTTNIASTPANISEAS